MDVSLPDSVKEWVEAQARSGRYASASDYVGDLIRRDQDHARQVSELQNLISEGMESGISIRPMSNILEEARRQVNALSKS